MRPIIAVIGNNVASAETESVADELGRRVVDAGWRIVSGGLGGVMLAASRGARSSSAYREGDVIGVLPTGDRTTANPYVDIAIPTNMGYARNVLVVSMADAVVAVGGGAGTLTEMAMAWQLDKILVGLELPGWSAELAGRALDGRPRPEVIRAASAEEAVAALARELRRASGS
jgi:uncharacterized protein (TIGR00725 family)